MINVPVDFFEFLSTKFAACSKPPSRDNHRKASYPRTQQRDHSIWVIVKTTPLPIRPRCRQLSTNMNFHLSPQSP